MKEDIHYLTYAKETLRCLENPGILLVAQGKNGQPNPMTIGWAMMGCMWGKPCFVTLVRPSRFTYGLLEENPEFTINVLPSDLAQAAGYCGSVSGRDEDKCAGAGLTAVPAKTVSVPVIDECVIHYECKVVHINETDAATMPPELAKMAYPGGDKHRMYYGEILAAYANPNARELV